MKNHKIKGFPEKKLCQINNLKIFSCNDHTYMVKDPDGHNLENFLHLEDAKSFCKVTKDFIKRRSL